MKPNTVINLIRKSNSDNLATAGTSASSTRRAMSLALESPLIIYTATKLTIQAAGLGFGGLIIPVEEIISITIRPIT